MFLIMAEAAVKLSDPQTYALGAVVAALVYVYKRFEKERGAHETRLLSEATARRAEMEDLRKRLRSCYEDLHKCDVEREALIVIVANLKGVTVEDMKREMAAIRDDGKT